MKIYCDYCGTQIDPAIHKNCPNCGGSYSNDDELRSIQARENKLEDLNIREKELKVDRIGIENDNLRNAGKQTGTSSAAKALGIGCLVPVIIIALCFAAVFVVALIEVADEHFNDSPEDGTATSVSSSYSMSMPSISIPDTDIEIPEMWSNVTAEFDEFAETPIYSVKCDSIEKIRVYPYDPSQGYMFVTFHILIKNTGEEKYSPTEDIMCLVDGVMCEYQYDNNHKRLANTPIPSGVMAEGYKCFEVPVGAEYFDIKYGEYVTLHIKNTINEQSQD